MGLNFDALSKLKKPVVETGLVFDEAKHQYRYNGKVVPSVTQILKAVGASPDMSGINPYYAQRGTALHKAIELWHRGKLDVDSIHEDIRPYFDAFTCFVVDEPNYKSVEQEKRYCNIEKYGTETEYPFAGTVDDVAEMSNNGNKFIIDYKTSSAIHPHYFLQLGAYMLLSGIDKGYILQLKKDKYNLVEVDEKYKNLFLKCLESYYSDMTDEEKKKAGSMIVKNQVDVDEIRAKSKMTAYIKAKETEKIAKSKLKETQAALEEQLEIDGIKYSGRYDTEDAKFSFTLIPESIVTRYDKELLELHVEAEVLEKCKVVTEKKAFYKLFRSEKEKKEVEPSVEVKLDIEIGKALTNDVIQKAISETYTAKEVSVSVDVEPDTNNAVIDVVIEEPEKPKSWDGGENYTKLIQDLGKKELTAEQKAKVIEFIEEMEKRPKEHLSHDDWAVWFYQIEGWSYEQLVAAMVTKSTDLFVINKVIEASVETVKIAITGCAEAEDAATPEPCPIGDHFQTEISEAMQNKMRDALHAALGRKIEYRNDGSFDLDKEIAEIYSNVSIQGISSLTSKKDFAMALRNINKLSEANY